LGAFLKFGEGSERGVSKVDEGMTNGESAKMYKDIVSDWRRRKIEIVISTTLCNAFLLRSNNEDCYLHPSENLVPI